MDVTRATYEGRQPAIIPRWALCKATVTLSPRNNGHDRLRHRKADSRADGVLVIAIPTPVTGSSVRGVL
jgi:hypothetical protein